MTPIGPTVADLTCEACQALIPELALGVVHGRDRADALAHVEHCPVCQHELLLMGDLADRLVELTPSAEPPAGFETRVLAALDASRGAAPAESSRAAHPSTATPAGARARIRWFHPAGLGLVAAMLAAAIGVGGWALGHHSSNPSPAVASAGGRAVVAELLSDRHPVGEVVVTGGRQAWMSMAIESSLGNQWVTCQVREQDGKVVTIGSFPLDNGSGYWAAAIPATASPVTGARLLDAAGSTLGSAALHLPQSFAR